EERLEGGQVELCGIGFDLSEIRVDGRIQRHVGADTDLQVRARFDAGAAGEAARPIERFFRPDARRRVRGDLEVAAWLDSRNAVQAAEARDEVGAIGARNQRPLTSLAEALDLPRKMHTPGLLRRRREAE